MVKIKEKNEGEKRNGVHVNKVCRIPVSIGRGRGKCSLNIDMCCHKGFDT